MSDQPYDPTARRATPLARKLKERIKREGPLSVEAYMAACLQDPEHGYYRTRQAIGLAGDFVTAPEISQVFGELIGLWAAVVWQQMGRPRPCRLIELGPGRGTLLKDALRASRIVPGFLDALELVLVESNRVLVAEQCVVLGPLADRAKWFEHVAEIPPGLSILIANEFLDTLPITQHQRTGTGWQERGVTCDDSGKLQFTLLDGRPRRLPDPAASDALPGVLFEQRITADIASDLEKLAAGGPLAALFLDYGHWGSATGDTLQAVRAQCYEHPLTSPGEADLTAQVEFESFANDVKARQLAVDGPVTHAEFLGALGIVERTSRLMSANPSRAAEIEAGVARLMSPSGMGSRFKGLGVRSPALPALPGFGR